MDELRIALQCCGTCEQMINTYREGKDTYECTVDKHHNKPLTSLFLVCKYYHKNHTLQHRVVLNGK